MVSLAFHREKFRDTECQEEPNGYREADAHLAWDAPRGALRMYVGLEDSQVMYIRTLRDAV